MAWNWKTFNTRALTALLFVIIMLTGLLVNKWSFLLLFTVIHFGCWLEYQKLAGIIDKAYVNINPFHKYGMMVAGYGLLLFFTDNWFVNGRVSLYAAGWVLALAGLLVAALGELLFSKENQLKNFGYSLLGLLYISLSFALLFNIRSGAIWMPQNNENGFRSVSVSLAAISGYAVPLILIAAIWINDTMAYIVGSLIGKTPLTSISPKKTWEGTVGGVILSVLVMWLAGYFINAETAWVWVCIAGIAAIAGSFGDILESKIKRMAGVKDSGSILPGHGGFLDRFDSLLLAIPFVWLFLKFIA